MTPAILRSRAPGVRLRLTLGFTILLAGLAAAVAQGAEVVQALLARHATASLALQASALAGAATGLGALGLLMPGFQAHRERSGSVFLFMALAAGMMAAAAAVSLVGPALQLSQATVAWDVVLAAGLGWCAMAGLDRWLPHLHPTTAAVHAVPAHALQLMVVAIAVHNLPEGFAVGAGFGGGEAMGWGTALSIGLQNIPEGLVVAVALGATGMPRWRAVAAAAATGLLEPLGAFAGAMAAGISAAALPWALACAGGAMAFVVVAELLPEALKGASRRAVGAAFALGTVAMVALTAGPSVGQAAGG